MEDDKKKLSFYLNGIKGPNTVGKDIGVITVLYPSDSSVVAPVPYIRNVYGESGLTYEEALKACKKVDENLRLTNLDELAALFVNKQLYDFGLIGGSYSNDGTWGLWSTKPHNIHLGSAWDLSFVSGLRRVMPRTETKGIRCVYR